MAVRLEAQGIQADGYVIDFGDVKKVARALCKELNEKFICPANSDVLNITTEGATLRIKCEDGSEFAFPKADTVMLPIKHSTVEELAHYLCCNVIERFTLVRLQQRKIKVIHVTVAEAPGQEAVYSRSIAVPPPPRTRFVAVP